MSEGYARIESTLIPMLRPLCPACQGRMMLTCIEPDCDGPDLRIFECSKCGHVYKAPRQRSDQIGQVTPERLPHATFASLKRLHVPGHCNFQF
jgi:hypothetical protein